jgi:hypothetical protein
VASCWHGPSLGEFDEASSSSFDPLARSLPLVDDSTSAGSGSLDSLPLGKGPAQFVIHGDSDLEEETLSERELSRQVTLVRLLSQEAVAIVKDMEEEKEDDEITLSEWELSRQVTMARLLSQEAVAVVQQRMVSRQTTEHAEEVALEEAKALQQEPSSGLEVGVRPEETSFGVQLLGLLGVRRELFQVA